MIKETFTDIAETEKPQVGFSFVQAALGVTIYAAGQNHDGDVIERPPLKDRKTVTKPKPKKPDMYAVLLHNDNVTPETLVVEVLKKFFNKGDEEANQLMLEVHRKPEGEAGVVGVYTLDIAETKINGATQYAPTLHFSREKD